MKYEWITINNERVAVKKSFGSWRVVHPIKNEDNSINWKNLLIGGSWWNLIVISIIILILAGLFREYSSQAKILNACLSALPDNINLNYFMNNNTINISALI